MEGLIPEFSIESVFLYPWREGFDEFLWIWVMGFLVSLSCGIVGNFIILRRMALVGDAISHSVLPGLVVAFLITGSLEGPVMIVGAAVAGVLTTLLIEIIHQNSRIKSDAALGIVFSTLFAIGVILITLFAGDVHLDVEHVLYGAIEFIAWQDAWKLGEMYVPYPVIQIFVVCLVVVLLVVAFYKELVATSFDPVMAASLGMPVRAIHYTLMALLAVVVVSAFSAVGAILVIAMLILPGITAALYSDRMLVLLFSSMPLSAAYAIGGMHVSLWLGCSIAGAMVVVAFGIFLISWVLSPHRGLIARFLRRKNIRHLSAEELESAAG
ncbi:MAG: metal ABC transporter permease [Opitutales bacterium]